MPSQRQCASKIRMKDIAAQAGVSQATVSAVYNNNFKLNLSEQTRSLIKNLLNEANFSTRRKPRQQTAPHPLTIRVASIFPTATYMREEILTGIERRLATEKGRMILNEMQTVVNSLCSNPEEFLQGVDGMIFLSMIPAEVKTILQAHSIPVVVIGTMQIDDEIDMIYPNFNEYIPKALKFLHAQGHRRIAYVSGPLPHSCFERSMMLFQGYGRKLGLEETELLVYEERKERDSYEIIREILTSHPRPTAILGQIAELRRFVEMHGVKVPEEISLLCFDCHGPDESPISNFAANNVTLGTEGVELIHYKISHPEALPRHLSMPLNYFDFGTCREPAVVKS